ncbi:MAG: hypothetical protein V1936_03480 [Patescibacteria group bacterium]
MKKFLLVFIAVIVLGSAAFFGKVWFDRPGDAQKFVNTALANSLALDSAKFASTIQVIADLGESGNGQLQLDLSGQIANATAYLPTLDYLAKIQGQGTLAGKPASLAAGGELKILDEIFYGRLDKITLTGFSPEALAQFDKLNGSAEKWFSLSFKKLADSDPKIAEVLEQQKTQQVALREKLKDFLAGNNVLLVQKMPWVFGGDVQPVEVSLNQELLGSDAFLTELAKFLTPSGLPEGAENPLAAQTQLLQQILKNILPKLNPQITLEISKSDGFLNREIVSLDLNLADLGQPSLPAGKLKIMINSQLSEINQPQTVEAPTEPAEEFDPASLTPAPSEEATSPKETTTPESDQAQTDANVTPTPTKIERSEQPVQSAESSANPATEPKTEATTPAQ